MVPFAFISGSRRMAALVNHIFDCNKKRVIIQQTLVLDGYSSFGCSLQQTPLHQKRADYNRYADYDGPEKLSYG